MPAAAAVRIQNATRKNEKYSKLLRRPEWKKKRDEVIAKAGNVCEDCGTDGRLQVHHPTYDKSRMPWEYDDLKALCPSCHRKADWKRIAGNGHSITPAQDALVGKYFHSLNDEGKVQWQGRVIGPTSHGCYLVQLFSWLGGDPSNCCLVPFEDMGDWLFYACQEHMVFSYDHGQAMRLRCDYGTPDFIPAQDEL